MSLYRYSDYSLISSITFETSDKGSVIAYLRANNGASSTLLAPISQHMREKGWFCTPFNYRNNPVLEVRKFGKENDLLRELKALHAISDDAHIDKSSVIPEKPLEFVKNRSLQTSGIMQMLGDGCFFMYGVKGGNLADTIAGILYNLGTLELFVYGRNDQSNREVKQISHKLNDYLEEYSIQAPLSCSLKNITEESKGGLVYNTKELLERYPSEIYNIFTGLAGLGVASAALGKMRHAPSLNDGIKVAETIKAAKWDIGLGLTTFGSTMFGLVVKEKVPDPDATPPATAIGKAWQKIQERPLRVTGAGLMVSTICHAISTATEYKEALRTNDHAMLSTVPWRGGFVAANLVAELLIIMSSKGHGDGVLSDSSVKNSIYESAAELIRAQPAEKRDEAFKHVVNFLGQPHIFAASTKEVENHLKILMDAQEQNPWACHHAEHEHIPSPMITPTSILTSPKQTQSPQLKHPDWQQVIKKPHTETDFQPRI